MSESIFFEKTSKTNAVDLLFLSRYVNKVPWARRESFICIKTKPSSNQEWNRKGQNKRGQPKNNEKTKQIQYKGIKGRLLFVLLFDVLPSNS